MSIWFIQQGERESVFTKEFISKTTFLSFPGLTGRLGRLAEERESRKTLDARLRTSGMTYKDVVCDVTNDRISNSPPLMVYDS